MKTLVTLGETRWSRTWSQFCLRALTAISDPLWLIVQVLMGGGIVWIGIMLGAWNKEAVPLLVPLMIAFTVIWAGLTGPGLRNPTPSESSVLL